MIPYYVLAENAIMLSCANFRRTLLCTRTKTPLLTLGNSLRINTCILSKCLLKHSLASSTFIWEKSRSQRWASTTTTATSLQRKTLSEIILNSLPSKCKPYASLIRLDRPTGTMLLFWPCAWSISLAATPGCLPDFWILSLFYLGAFVMRGAGCTINDMWDRKIDTMVERTRNRPIASKQITPWNALVFLSAQMGIGCMILLQLNWYSILLGASSLPLVCIYPLAKRFTYYPQVVLGLTFNWGALLGWSAVQGYCDWSICLPLYLSGICWTLVYDTMYALQDKRDDLLIGIKSTAIKWGDKVKTNMSLFSASMVGSLVLTGFASEQTWPYYAGVALIGAHLWNQIYTLNVNDFNDGGKKFRSNNHIGWILFAAIMAGTLTKKKEINQEDSGDITLDRSSV